VVQEVDRSNVEAVNQVLRQTIARVRALTAVISGEIGGLRAVAERLYDERRRRDARFPPGLFGEPAWDLLLALFVAYEDGRDLTLPEAYEAARIDPAEGPALVEKLTAAGLVTERRTRQDRRRMGLGLTDLAVDRLVDYFADVA
jgi:DNA-binding MarR family transcriptional regulator